MKDAESTLTRIFSGADSTRNQGYMLVPPLGYLLTGALGRALVAAYGTEQHPDLRVVSPDGKGNMITVDAIREVLPFLASSAADDGMKTLVILEAHRMNGNAANALLKPLEEPTRHTRIVLITDRPHALPVTIRSRCAVVTIAPSDTLAQEDLLVRIEGDAPDPSRVEAALRASDRNPALASVILQHDLVGWLSSLRTWLAGNDPTPPLPPVTGKDAVPLSAIALSVQALCVRAARGEEDALIQGWSVQRVRDAAWQVIASLDDIDRAGIDAKARLHSLFLALRAQRA